MKKNKIQVFEGVGSFVDAHTVEVSGKEKARISAKNIIIATGSEAAGLPFMPFDGKTIISSDEAIALNKVPEHLIVIGGGVIGVEIGSVYARLGARVSVVEFLGGVIPTMDGGLGKALEKSLKGLGFEFHFNTKVTGASVQGKKVVVSAEHKDNGPVSVEGDVVLLAIGRKAFTGSLKLENVGIRLDNRGRVPINSHFQTSVPNIYAIGDVVEGAMLAHKASEEGVACAEIIAGKAGHMNYGTIPSVVYTWPEVASVGQSEEQLKAANIPYKSGSFPFKASGRARASEESEGFAKVLAHAQTDEILGVHIIGPRASDMIASAVVAMEYRASAEDIGIITAAHPTFTEAIKEAALAATANRPLHL
jgi:dihydrolipoamide dehydrogenase